MALGYFTRRRIEQFVSREFAQRVEHAQGLAEALPTAYERGFDVPASVVEHGEARVREAEAAQALFEETVRPHLGDRGLAGELAERQLLLMAAMFQGSRGYSEDWRP